MNRKSPLLSSLVLLALPWTAATQAYTVPEGAKPLSATPPAYQTPPSPSPPLDPPITPPLPPPPEPFPTPPPPRAPTARELALAGMEYSPEEYFVLGGQSVYTPRPIPLIPFRKAAGFSCPAPRYSAPGAVAFGWSASGSPPAEFEECGDRVRAMSFFLASSGRRGRPLEGLSAEQYSEWQGGVSDDDALNLGKLAAASAARALGAYRHSLENARPIQSGGMPGASGAVRLSSRRGKDRVMEFSAVVTAAGRGEFSTWTACVVLAERGRELLDPAVTAPALARAYYYLNRDFNAAVSPPSPRGGPFARRRLP